MAFRKNPTAQVNGYLLSHHETRVINECFRQLRAGARAQPCKKQRRSAAFYF